MDKILAVTINLQDKQIKPSTETQIVTADENYSGLDKVIVEPQSGVPEPTKSWLYITEYDSNGYPIKAKTIGCSGYMPIYLCGSYDTSSKSMLSSNLQEFEINKGVTYIGQMSFKDCSSLKSITIPESVTYIEDYAFQSCSSLKSITIPESVTYIGRFAFQSCSQLTSINIPYGEVTIRERCFKYCSNLKSVIMPDSIKSTALECFYGCSSLQNIKLSSNLKNIYSCAFQSCSSLTSIELPTALTKIGSSAFNSCSKLELFDFRNLTQVPTLSNVSAFSSTPSTKKIVVPDTLYDEWIVATNWSSSDNNIVTSIIKASDYEASL